MHRTKPSVSLALLAAGAFAWPAFGQYGDAAPPTPPTPAPDTSPDTAPDTAPDLAPDTAPDTAPEPVADALPPIPTPPPAPIADGEEFPSGMDVIRRSIKARGGADFWQNLETVRLTGEIELVTMGGARGEITVYLKNPNAMHALINLPAFNVQVIRAAAGNTAWVMQPGAPAPAVVRGEMAKAMIDDADFLAPVQPERVYSAATVTAIEDVRGVSAYRVEATTTAGDTRVLWYALDTGYELRVDDYDQNGTITRQVYTSDYRRFGDFMHATRTETTGRITGTRVITYSMVDYDVEIPEGLLTPPGEL